MSTQMNPGMASSVMACLSRSGWPFLVAVAGVFEGF